MTEHELQSQIIEYLVKLGWLVIRVNSGRKGNVAFVSWYTADGRRTKGVPDLIAVKDGTAIFVEAKWMGGHTRPEQVEFAEALDKHGMAAHYVKPWSWEGWLDAVGWLKEEGVMA